MADLGFVEAFSKYGAQLANPMWAVSAIAKDGSLVISCWAHHFHAPEKGVLRYEDRLSRWSGNSPGNDLLRSHLASAQKDRLLVRLVVATTEDTEAVDSGHDASKVRKTFHVRNDVVGRIVEFDGDRFVIDFKKR